AGTLAAAIPLVLHLLKREPEARVKFAAVKLLKHAPIEYTDRRRLRELLLLALRIATLVLLALAFARPFRPSAAALASSGTTIVVTDRQESGWDAGDRASIPEGAKIEVIDVGEPPANLAVTSVRVLADRITAMVRNTAPRTRDAKVHLTLDGRKAGDAVV